MCAHRSHSFEGLAPGSLYAVEVISTSRGRRSKPASMTINTSKLKNLRHMQYPATPNICVPTFACVWERERKYLDYKMNVAGNE